MYLGPDSVALLRHLPTLGGKGNLLDLCCGSGVQGIVAVRCGYASSADLVDVNLRALRFTAFNARLNRVANKCRMHHGDLYDALASKTKKRGTRRFFDGITANPPFVPVPPPHMSSNIGAPAFPKRYDTFSADPSGHGDGILRKIVTGATVFLRPYIPVHMPSPKLMASSSKEEHNKDAAIDDAPVAEMVDDVHEISLAHFIQEHVTGAVGSLGQPSAVVILRGVSGAGKSSIASRVQAAVIAEGRDCTVCSADSFFVDADTGEYRFDRALLPDAHAACFTSFAAALGSSTSPQKLPSLVIVDNTNTKRWEYRKYEQEASRVGARVTILELVLQVPPPRPSTAAATGNIRHPPSSISGEDNAVLAAIAARNVHGVPPEIVAAMHDRFEDDSRAFRIPICFASQSDSTTFKAVAQVSDGCSSTNTCAPLPGGVLAVVTELPNPAAYGEAVLKPLLDEHWRPFAAAAVASISGESEQRDSHQHNGGSDNEGLVGIVRGSVVHDSPPWTAKEYVGRRTGSEGHSKEAQAWGRHLEAEGISSMANALLFVSVGTTPAACDATERNHSQREDAPPTTITVRSFEAKRSWSATDLTSDAAVCDAARYSGVEADTYSGQF